MRLCKTKRLDNKPKIVSLCDDANIVSSTEIHLHDILAIKEKTLQCE